MTTLIPPQKEELVQNPDGTWDSVHSVAEITARGRPEGMSEKEWDKLIAELGPNNGSFSVGGYGHWTEKNVNPRAMWRKQEWGQWNKFMRMRYRLSTERIPIEHETLRVKIIKTFSTTDPQQFKQMLNANMQNNPRLDVKTRRGLVKTTVIDQAVFARRASSEDGKS